MAGILTPIQQVALLEDELRHQMYDFIRGRGRPVTRHEVARHLGVSTNLAAFHLDKLTDAGLLTARYERPTDHPAVTGRAPKVYESSEAEIEISIPPRRYDIPAIVLARALRIARGGEDTQAAAERVAGEYGIELGRAAKEELRGPRRGRERALRRVKTLLRPLGYEPYDASEGEVRLRNCPFDKLVKESQDVICPINRAFIGGVLEGLGSRLVGSALERPPGECCVVLRSSRGAP